MPLDPHVAHFLQTVAAASSEPAPSLANTFASYHLPHRRDPREDLDMASYGVVKVLEDRLGLAYPDMAWEPKAAFTALADSYHG